MLLYSIPHNIHMEHSSEKYHSQTQKYIDTLSKDKQQSLCQYFTPHVIQQRLIDALKDVHIQPNSDVLDPACGTGELLYACAESDVFQNPTLYGWEKDGATISVAENIVPSSTITQTDTIRHEVDDMFDCIIMNPPYGEIQRDEYINNKYEDIVYGRQNMYGLFIYKSIQHLRDNGILACIVPPGMNNGAYFEPLREYIAQTCTIQSLEIIPGDHFDGVEQPVMILVCEKQPQCERDDTQPQDFMIRKGNTLVFTEHADEVQARYNETKTIEGCGYTVSTGSIIGNEHRDKTHNTPQKTEHTIPLIWASNITNGFRIAPDEHTKPQYIELPPEKHATGPALVVNRIIGRPTSGSISVGKIPDGKRFVAENHVNVITATPNTEQDISLTELQTELENPQNAMIIRKLIGNTQLSKTELQTLFPIETN